MTVVPAGKALARCMFRDRFSHVDTITFVASYACASNDMWWTAFIVVIAGLVISSMGNAAVEGMR